jgi:hypothetical protein
MRVRPTLLCLAVALTGTLSAQKRADQARLMFTVSIGQNSGGGQLWSVGAQPFNTIDPVDSLPVTDTLSVSRFFRRSLSVQFAGSYFPNANVGFTGEALLLGLGTTDGCRIKATTGSSETSDLCRTIRGHQRSATATALSGSVVYRAFINNPVHPYVRAGAGFVISQQSLLKTQGGINTSQGVAELTLYEDTKARRIHPYLSFGAGLVAVAGPGYQLRLEVRDNYVRIPAVAGPTPRQGVRPPDTTVGRHFVTALIGFDVVLERKRGRRY